MANKNAVYHGVAPYEGGIDPYPDWSPAHQRDLGEDDYQSILGNAQGWLKSKVLTEGTETLTQDQLCRAALDYAIQASPYNRQINVPTYNWLLSRLKGEPEDLGGGEGDMILRAATAQQTSGATNMDKKAAAAVSDVLTRLDKMAGYLQENYAKLGFTQQQAKGIVNHLDRTADQIEKDAFGEASLQTRQAKVVTGAVHQRDSDEPYMDTFNAPMAPVQTDADEPYMSAYSDDQSSAVEKGKEERGDPLAP